MARAVALITCITFLISFSSITTANPVLNLSKSTSQYNETYQRALSRHVEKRASQKMTFVRIPGGEVRLDRKVYVKPFKLMTTEVTQQQWITVMGHNPSRFKDCGSNCPVERVSEPQLTKFMELLSQQTGKRYRLPFEAEWQLAARAGRKTLYSWGVEISCSMARYGYGNRECDNRAGPVEVASFQPNAYGLYDMHGNVSEWVSDCWPEEKKDTALAILDSFFSRGGASESRCDLQLIRGGSWRNASDWVTAIARDRPGKYFREKDVGFRLVEIE